MKNFTSSMLVILAMLTALLGHYVQNAFFLNAFAVALPDQPAEPLLPVG